MVNVTLWPDNVLTRSGLNVHVQGDVADACLASFRGLTTLYETGHNDAPEPLYAQERGCPRTPDALQAPRRPGILRTRPHQGVPG